MKVISVNNVSKSFRIFKERSSTLKERIIFRRKNRFEQYSVLDNISIEIEKGQTVGLVGRNGSGKSTLLKLLTGILYPDKGSIDILGKVSSLLELGAGFQPDFTGRENIFLNASILGLSKKEIKNKLEQIITFSELKEYIDNPVRNYSSGMYMRLAFSVAISIEPDILLIDEVLAVGDAAFQQKCMDTLIKLKTKGTTIVFVSHDLGSMEKLCDRLVWINKGSIVDDGIPRKVIDKYLAFLADEENRRLIEEQIVVTKIGQSIATNQKIEKNKIENDENNAELDRWGNRFVEIIDVSINDQEGTQKLSFMSGEQMIIHLKYKVNKSVEKPVFGVGFFTIEHTHCYGTNTDIDKYNINELVESDEGTVSFIIPSLDLVKGTYLLSLAAHDKNGNPYDYHDKRYSFKVSSLTDDVGIAKLKHNWSHEIVREIQTGIKN